ncbi:MAG: primosomal protein N' [Ferruginibacter sp.]|nr:primosomal protein N' [Cytophagales bacterium]
MLPVPIPNLFTYRVPREFGLLIKVGARVIVQFGKSRVLTALVARLHHKPPEKYVAKYLLDLLDEHPLVNPPQLDLFQWIADYYMCCAGEVMQAALPSGLKISSLSKIQPNPDFDSAIPLTDKETRLMEAVRTNQSLTYDEAARVLGQPNVYQLLKTLVGKRAILLFEEVKEKYRPKVVKKVRLTAEYRGRQRLSDLFLELEKKPKQTEVLLHYLQKVPLLRDPHLNADGLEKNVLTADERSASSLSTLLKNRVFEEFEIVVSRFADLPPAENSFPRLTEAQRRASDQVMEFFATRDTVLLHGITGSGKTEIYIDLIQKVLDGGSQVLYLLPEIAVTTQIVARLKKIFGNRMGVYHSKFSDNERVEVWKGIVAGEYAFVIGVRSAVFLPFDNLGLIIVDEEHETSYKQHDPAPRYHARDVAMVIAQRQQAKVLLGSATPSVESYYHAQAGRYGMVKLTQRFGQATLPDIVLVDTRQERKQQRMKNAFSTVLLDHLSHNLEKKEQSILFQNRRGYSPYLNCEECDWVAKCNQCAVSLTYHLQGSELRCHYCGFKQSVPRACPACGSTKIRAVGYGTEKIEDELKLHLPGAHVQRMDLDTTRKKNAYEQLIHEFENGHTDILVGTQMISKGLDFDKVSLVGIFDADRIINFPDFRSHERAFQMITQVSGRAGRRAIPGKVIIQTANPQQMVLQRVLANDYESLYQTEIADRESFHYPPFFRLIRLTVKHESKTTGHQAAVRLAEKLGERLGQNRVLGPEFPLVERIRNQYLEEIMIKLERNINLKAVKHYIRQQLDDLQADKSLKGTSVVVDVDCV